MPTIREYGSAFDISMDVEVEVFLDECNSKEINEVIKWLEESDYIKSEHTTNCGNLLDEEWNKTINKLHTLRQQLTVEEEELIKSIVNKY
jgi:hypothetical protein